MKHVPYLKSRRVWKSANSALPLVLCALCALYGDILKAQNPQTTDIPPTQPLYSLNAAYVNGIAPGYWATAGSGLTVNLSAGSAFCGGAIQTYAGGTLTATASTTNYVYLNTGSSCAPAIKTSAFTSADIPIAKVVAGSSTITSITDDRTPFAQGGPALPLSETNGGFGADIHAQVGVPVNASGSFTFYTLQGTDTNVLSSGTISGSAGATLCTDSNGGATTTACGGGSVTSFSSGNLSPLFTTSVTNSTTTPSLAFTLTNQSANLVYAGPSSGSAAAPTFRSLVGADLPNPAASTLGGVESIDCTATGHIVSISTSGVPTCSADGSGGGAASNIPFVVSAPVSPAIPYAGLIAWFSGDCIVISGTTCSTPSDGTDLTTSTTNGLWYDRSGTYSNAYADVGSTPGPVFHTSQINSQPAVTFNGTSARMYFATITNIQSAVTTDYWLGGEFTIFAVAKSTSNSNAFYITSSGTNAPSFIMNRDQGGGAKTIVLEKPGDGTIGTGTAAGDDTTWHQVNAVCQRLQHPVFRKDRSSDATLSGANCLFHVDSSNSSNVPFQWIGFEGGNNNYGSGQLAELILYRRALTSSEITTVESYLHTKYGL